MYGMMPSAKIVSRRMLPPANRSKNPKIVPAADEELLPARYVDARAWEYVTAQPVHGEQAKREQDPLAQVRNPKYVRKCLEKLHGSFDRPERFLPARRLPITSAVPPAARIFSSADFENRCAFT